jgi:hypothetical protein
MKTTAPVLKEQTKYCSKLQLGSSEFRKHAYTHLSSNALPKIIVFININIKFLVFLELRFRVMFHRDEILLVLQENIRLLNNFLLSPNSSKLDLEAIIQLTLCC